MPSRLDTTITLCNHTYMASSSGATDWREARRRGARATIVSSAWDLVREEGLPALSLRELARRSGITTPTVYAYFDSKSAIYDAMFGDAAEEFVEWMAEPVDTGDPVADLTIDARRFLEFCTADIPRYQLLFQHTIAGFSPSTQSYAPAVRALERTQQLLRRTGVSNPRYVDLWTALTTGLVDQQISNDPGGSRWSRLIDDAVRMFVAYCHDPKFATADQHPTPNESA